MHKVKHIFFILLSMATGAVFLLSAYTKLLPSIQAFEYNVASQTHLPYMTAAIISRFFIALEAGLGSLIFIHFFGKNNWVLKLGFAVIAGFSVYLVWLWIKQGNDVNCGCFGDSIWMRPSTSLIKNVLFMLALWALMRYHKGLSFAFSNLVPFVHLICAFTLTYFMFPVFTHYKLNFDAIYADRKHAPTTDLAKGKYIIAFVSCECSHCRAAATIMHGMKEKNPAIPFYLLVNGSEEDMEDFWKETNAQDIPHAPLAEEPFDRYTGGEYPQIVWVNNGEVEANTTYPELDQKLIEKWMN